MQGINWNYAEGAWEQCKGQVKQKWSKLTEDDLTYINGSRDRLVGVLQQRYGLAQSRVEEQVTEFAGPAEAPAADGWLGRTKQRIAGWTTNTKEYFQSGKVKALVGDAEEYMRRHPLPSTLAAMGVGFVLGMLLSGRRPKVVAEPSDL